MLLQFTLTASLYSNKRNSNHMYKSEVFNIYLLRISQNQCHKTHHKGPEQVCPSTFDSSAALSCLAVVNAFAPLPTETLLFLLPAQLLLSLGTFSVISPTTWNRISSEMLTLPLNFISCSIPFSSAWQGGST